MDEAIAERIQRLKDAAVSRDTERLWMLTTAAIESGFVKHLSLTGPQADKMRGRSKVSIKSNKPQASNLPAPEKDPKDETAERKRIIQVKRRADNLRSQANTLAAIARDVHAVSCKPLGSNLGRPTHVE